MVTIKLSNDKEYRVKSVQQSISGPKAAGPDFGNVPMVTIYFLPEYEISDIYDDYNAGAFDTFTVTRNEDAQPLVISGYTTITNLQRHVTEYEESLALTLIKPADAK